MQDHKENAAHKAAQTLQNLAKTEALEKVFLKTVSCNKDCKSISDHVQSCEKIKHFTILKIK